MDDDSEMPDLIGDLSALARLAVRLTDARALLTVAGAGAG